MDGVDQTPCARRSVCALIVIAPSGVHNLPALGERVDTASIMPSEYLEPDHPLDRVCTHPLIVP